MLNLMDGRNSTILRVVNEYPPYMARELIMPPRVPMNNPSIKKGNLIKADYDNFDTWLTGTITFHNDQNGMISKGYFKGKESDYGG